jgi:prepilin-type N-terminal cleavage/methylation domain-containing protein
LILLGLSRRTIWRDQRRRSVVEPGFTLIELMLAMAISVVLIGVAIPVGGDALDDMRTRAAARYLAGRIANSRLGAINRSRAIGLRFVAGTPDYEFGTFVDGNGNGVRTADIQAGTDFALEIPRRLGSDFRGVHFGLMVGISDIDGVGNTNPDGVRIGTPKILTISPEGTATSGTLYVQGTRAQYAVRVLGATGRTRLLKYESGSRSWVST